MIELNVLGIEEIRKQIDALARDQIPYATMVGINNTAFAVRRTSGHQLQSAFNNPTPLIKSATRVQKATKETLEALVFIDPKRELILRTHEEGGIRGRQAIERFVIAKGWMPSSWRAVPGVDMPVNSYGNPRLAVIKQIIAELSAGISGVRGSTTRCFVIRPGQPSHLRPGIYRLKARSKGRGLLLLYLFVSSEQYKKILNWRDTVEQEARRVLPDEVARGIQRAIDTAR